MYKKTEKKRKEINSCYKINFFFTFLLQKEFKKNFIPN